MAYTTIDKPSDYFNTVLYTGNSGSNRGITGVGFQPDWVWLKTRSKANSHILIDSVRGQERLRSNTTGGEVDVSSEFISFDTDGFTVTENAANEMNNNSTTYANWNWKAGTSFTNDASSTGIGSIDSTGSVNTDAGFSICSFTGTGSNGTVKHGLSTAPKMIIFKNRPQAEGWIVYHQAISNTHFLTLNTTGVAVDNATMFNDTSPTSSVFSVGSNHGTNGPSHAMIAYCFADVKGYSKFGSYTGNGNADGTFVYTGFKVGWLMIKRTTAVDTWHLVDNKRDPHNMVEQNQSPDTAYADNANAVDFDFLSNGFKLRNNDNNGNNSGDTYIYMCFAENPFVTSTGVPATAR